MHVNAKTAHEAGIQDGGWMWVESMHGKVRCLCRYSEAVEPGTIWTWNAIGKASGAWGLDSDANESRLGFLLNHVISEELPPSDEGGHLSNSDPITGQAGWYDVHVRIYPAGADEPNLTSPQTRAVEPVPGQAQETKRGRWLTYFAGRNRK
jgi:anaerobic selenocysteine-containing dehydrogenase